MASTGVGQELLLIQNSDLVNRKWSLFNNVRPLSSRHISVIWIWAPHTTFLKHGIRLVAVIFPYCRSIRARDADSDATLPGTAGTANTADLNSSDSDSDDELLGPVFRFSTSAA